MNSFDFDLNHRVALVTGGSRGIGRATALRLAEAGATVVINYLRSGDAAEKVVREMLDFGGEAAAIQGDISDLRQAENLVSETVRQFKRLDILVCNAGIWEGDAVDLLSEALWDRTIDVNLKGTWTVCRAAVPLMKEQRFGRIVIVSSTAGQRGEANVSNYAASKGGQISFTKSLAAELAQFGINVNCIAPGWVETEMSSTALADPARGDEIRSTIPLGRAAKPDEIALPIVFLCSGWASNITGEVLNVNGGSVFCG